MKQLEVNKTIIYRWWRKDGEDIDSKHQEALEESADKRINEMILEGYTSGELSDNIRMLNKDPQDGIEYSGWWELNTIKL